MTENASRLALAVAITSAFVTHNRLGSDQVADLVTKIAASLDDPGSVGQAAGPGSATPPTAALIRKSIGVETLISFEDGKAYRTLKRHLAIRGLTPAAYRIKWGLPGDYPMVAPAYSAARSEIAHRIGLGRGGRKRPDGAARAKARSNAALAPSARTTSPARGAANVSAAKPPQPVASSAPASTPRPRGRPPTTKPAPQPAGAAPSTVSEAAKTATPVKTAETAAGNGRGIGSLSSALSRLKAKLTGPKGG